MSDGNTNGAQKGARLKAAVRELEAATPLFPLAKSMIEGLQGAKEAAVEAMTDDNNGLRAKLAGLSKMAAEIEINSGSVKADAARVASAEQALQEIGRSLDEKATGAQASASEAKAASEEVQAAISTLRIKVGEKEYAGAQALGILATVISQIPGRVKNAVEGVVTAEVTDDEGKKVTKSGTALVSHLASELEIVKRAAGAAVADAEHANELLTEGGRMVTESNDAAMKAEGEAAAAKAEATEAKAEVETLKGALAEAQKDLKVMFGIVTGLLRRAGIDTEVTEEIVAEAEDAAEAQPEDVSMEGVANE